MSCSIYCEGDNHEFSEDEYLGETRTHKKFLKSCVKCDKQFIDYENKKTGEYDFMEEVKNKKVR